MVYMGWEGQGKDKACTWAWAASGLHAQHTARGGEGRGGEGRGGTLLQGGAVGCEEKGGGQLCEAREA